MNELERDLEEEQEQERGQAHRQEDGQEQEPEPDSGWGQAARRPVAGLEGAVTDTGVARVPLVGQLSKVWLQQWQHGGGHNASNQEMRDGGGQAESMK